MSRFHSFMIVLVFLGLTGGVVYAAWRLTLADVPQPTTADDRRNFFYVAGVGITAVSAVMGAWLSLRNLAAQARNATDLERLKKVLEKRIPAYGSLYASAMTYYRALAPLETGNFNLESIESAETKMKEAEGEALFVQDEFYNHWSVFWQKARTAKETAHHKAGSVDERKALWKDVAKSLAQELKGMKAFARKEIS